MKHAQNNNNDNNVCGTYCTHYNNVIEDSQIQSAHFFTTQCKCLHNETAVLLAYLLCK